MKKDRENPVTAYLIRLMPHFSEPCELLLETKYNQVKLWNMLVKNMKDNKEHLIALAKETNGEARETLEKIEKELSRLELRVTALRNGMRRIRHIIGLKTLHKIEKEEDIATSDIFHDKIRKIIQNMNRIQSSVWKVVKDSLGTEKMTELRKEYDKSIYQIRKQFNLSDGNGEVIEEAFKGAQKRFFSQNPAGTGSPKFKRNSPMVSNGDRISIYHRFRSVNQFRFKDIFSNTQFIRVKPFETNEWEDPTLTRDELIRATQTTLSISLSSKKRFRGKKEDNPDYKREILEFSPVFHRIPTPDALVVSVKLICNCYSYKEWEYFAIFIVEEPIPQKPTQKEKSEFTFISDVKPYYEQNVAVNVSLGYLMNGDREFPLVLPGVGCTFNSPKQLYEKVEWTILSRRNDKAKHQKSADLFLEECKDHIKPFVRKFLDAASNTAHEKLVNRLRALHKMRESGLVSMSYFLKRDHSDNEDALQIADIIDIWYEKHKSARLTIANIESKAVDMKNHFFHNVAVHIAERASKVTIVKPAKLGRKKINPKIIRKVEARKNAYDRVASVATFCNILETTCKKYGVIVDKIEKKELDNAQIN